MSNLLELGVRHIRATKSVEIIKASVEHFIGTHMHNTLTEWATCETLKKKEINEQFL